MSLGSPCSRSFWAILHCLQVQDAWDPSPASSLSPPGLYNSGTEKGDPPRALLGTECMDRPAPNLLSRAQPGIGC